MRMRGKSRSQLTVRYVCKAYSRIDHVNVLVLVNVNVPQKAGLLPRGRLRSRSRGERLFCLELEPPLHPDPQPNLRLKHKPHLSERPLLAELDERDNIVS